MSEIVNLEKSLGIMQPYLFPYIGYFQLIKAVDSFVIYDNIKYTKKGWINRNRILVNGQAEYFSVPLKKDSDFLNVNQRFLATSYAKDCIKLISKIKESYKKAPHFESVFPMVVSILKFEKQNLFDFLLHSLKVTCAFLDINTKIIVSSTIDIDHDLKSQDKVISIVKKMGASQYLNPIGGLSLYSKSTFESNQLKLNFILQNPIEYQQFGSDFVPWLSIIDVMMFNSKEEIKKFLDNVSFQ